MKRTILFISPGENVPGAMEELRQLQDYHYVEPVTGIVTHYRLIDLVQKNKYNVLWFATHGDENGVRISDDYLSSGDVIRLLHFSEARLLFINSCSTHLLPNRIRIARVHILAGIEENLDSGYASEIGIYFAKLLNEKRSIRAAYDNLHDDNNYLYLSPNSSLEEKRWYFIIAIAALLLILLLASTSIGG